MDPRIAKYASSRTDSTMRHATPERRPGGPVADATLSGGPDSGGAVPSGPIASGPVYRGASGREPGGYRPSERAMTTRLSSVFPRPAASDADDVVWTLQTAAVQWQRGLRADAIVWVRKAADTATQLGHDMRADELRTHAARLAEFLWTDPEETIQDAPIMTPTPDDAVADISDEDLSYYREGGEGSEPTHVLPDDLDLRSDSELPTAEHDDDPHDAMDTLTNEAGHDAYLSISPEPDEESDSYLSISPEPEAGADADTDTDTEIDADAHEGDTTRPARRSNGQSSLSPSHADGSLRPRVGRSSLPVRALHSEPGDALR